MRKPIVVDCGNRAFRPLIGHVTVTLDGVDVSNQCTRANEETGDVVLYRLNENGHKYVEGEDPAMEMKTGAVEIKLRDDATVEARALYAELRREWQ